MIKNAPSRNNCRRCSASASGRVAFIQVISIPHHHDTVELRTMRTTNSNVSCCSIAFLKCLPRQRCLSQTELANVGVEPCSVWSALSVVWQRRRPFHGFRADFGIFVAKYSVRKTINSCSTFMHAAEVSHSWLQLQYDHGRHTCDRTMDFVWKMGLRSSQGKGLVQNYVGFYDRGSAKSGKGRVVFLGHFGSYRGSPRRESEYVQNTYCQ